MAQSLDVQLSKIKIVLPNGRLLFGLKEFNIPHGRHVLVQGESGKGKTTLLHLIAGLFSPSEGYVSLGGRELNRLTDEERCEIRRKYVGVVFQKLNLIDHFTIKENILLSGVEEADNIQSSLKRVNLDGRENELCGVLSLGEQQRVAVARVLAQKPEIILADEPTSSLDQKNTDFVLASLKSAAKGKTLVVVSHDHRIKNYFDEVIQFEDLVR